MPRNSGRSLDLQHSIGRRPPFSDPLADGLRRHVARLGEGDLATLAKGGNRAIERGLLFAMLEGGLMHRVHCPQRKAYLYGPSSIGASTGVPVAGRIKGFFMAHIKNRLREAFDAARDARGLTQRALAASIGVTPQAVNGWFRTGRISKANLAAFARIVGSDFEFLAAGAHVIEEEMPAGPRKLTVMGERILDHMTANGLRNQDDLAATIGLTPERFNAWLYLEQRVVEARPLLRLAEALNTNADYLLGDSDDPRMEESLTFREHQLLMAFRELSDDQRDLLMKTATAWHEQSEIAPSAAGPFRNNGNNGGKH